MTGLNSLQLIWVLLESTGALELLLDGCLAYQTGWTCCTRKNRAAVSLVPFTTWTDSAALLEDIIDLDFDVSWHMSETAAADAMPRRLDAHFD